MPYSTGNALTRLVAFAAAKNPLKYVPVRSILRNEPLRARAYALTVLVAVYLVGRGIISATDKDFIVSVVAIVLGVEWSRTKVSPVKRQD